MPLHARTILLTLLVLAAGCACEGTTGAPDASSRPDAGSDALARDDAGSDAPQRDAGLETGRDAGADAAVGADAGPSCLEDGHAAGERFALPDHCNFCDCNADGTRTCTTRTCGPAFTTCELDGTVHEYGESFELGDGCNECVCAASGLACTRRTCMGAREEGAILLEDLNASCGDRAAFSAANVLAEMPFDVIDAPFPYERMRETYPESRADTTVSVRIAYAGGFAVCRLEAPGRAAIDMEVAIEWRTADGAFDEGLHGYLRKNDFGFLDAWFVLSTLPVASLTGTYSPACPMTRDLSFSAQIERTGAASGSVMKACEGDIGLEVGRFEVTP